MPLAISGARAKIYKSYESTSGLFSVIVHSNNIRLGTVSVSPQEDWFSPGASVTITAVPADGCKLVSWSDGSTDPVRIFTVNNNIELTANFVDDYIELTVVPSPTNAGTATGSGRYVHNSSATLVAAPNTGYRFSHWSNGVTTARTSVLCRYNATFVAYFVPDISKVTLTVLASPTVGGITQGSGTYDIGTSVNIKATANPGYQFSKWADGNTSASRVVIAAATTTYTALFLPIYSLILNASPALGGNPTPAGQYVQGTVLLLRANPNLNYRFVKWSDGDNNANRSYTLMDNTTLTAYYVRTDQVTVSTAVSPTASGVVTGAGVYTIGEIVTLKATPAVGCTFDHWSNGVTTPTYSFTATTDVLLTAYFATSKVTIITSVTPASSGTVTGGGEYDYGSTVTLVATPAPGYEFEMWSNGATTPTISFIATTDASYRATFKRKTVTISTFVTPSGAGTVTGGGTYYYGTSVTLTATPTGEYVFEKWNDGVTTASRTFVATADASYTAVFYEEKEFYIYVSKVQGISSTTGTGYYDSGEICTMSAVPLTGYRFYRWSGVGPIYPEIPTTEMYDNPKSFSVVKDRDIWGNAVPADHKIVRITITPEANEPWNSVIANNAIDFVPGEMVYLTRDEYTKYSKYYFKGWPDGSMALRYEFYPTDDVDMHLEFEGPGTIVYSHYESEVTPPFSDVVYSGSGAYQNGDTATISVTFDPIKYQFSSWQWWYMDDHSTKYTVTTPSFNLAVTDRNIVVYGGDVSLRSYTVTGKASTGGKVNGVTTYTESVHAYESVELVATADDEYLFDSWSDGVLTASRTISNVTADITVTANFVVDTRVVITTAVSPDDSGTVTGGGKYSVGSTVTLTATHAQYFKFDHWSSGETTETITFTATVDETRTAYFTSTKAYVTTSVSPAGSGTVTGGGLYEIGDYVTLFATPASGYKFKEWDTGEKTTTLSFTATGDVTKVATFVEASSYVIDCDIVGTPYGSVTGTGIFAPGASYNVKFIYNTGYYHVNWWEDAYSGVGLSGYAVRDRNLFVKFMPNSVEDTTCTYRVDGPGSSCTFGASIYSKVSGSSKATYCKDDKPVIKFFNNDTTYRVIAIGQESTLSPEVILGQIISPKTQEEIVEWFSCGDDYTMVLYTVDKVANNDTWVCFRNQSGFEYTSNKQKNSFEHFNLGDIVNVTVVPDSTFVCLGLEVSIDNNNLGRDDFKIDNVNSGNFDFVVTIPWCYKVLPRMCTAAKAVHHDIVITGVGSYDGFSTTVIGEKCYLKAKNTDPTNWTFSHWEYRGETYYGSELRELCDVAEPIYMVFEHN